MCYVLIADTCLPDNNSASVQLTDLLNSSSAKKSSIIILVPDPNIDGSFLINTEGNHTYLRVKSPEKKGKPYALRLLIELTLPLLFLRAIIKSRVDVSGTVGIIWYSPMIFWAPLIHYLKLRYSAKTYLILRDIFPEWAVNLKIIKNSFLIIFFRLFAKYQYYIADIIGVQSPGNLDYFTSKNYVGKVEVLYNWLSTESDEGNKNFDFNETKLKGRKIFIYAGNMGVAQGLENLIQVCINMKDNQEIGFAFFGIGNDLIALKDRSNSEKLNNVLVSELVPAVDMPYIMQQCHAGLVALDRRHKSHNIPGKFLTYMANGLPVLAHINPGNDLENLIISNDVGLVVSSEDYEELESAVKFLGSRTDDDGHIKKRCLRLCENLFVPDRAWEQICSHLSA